MVGPGTGIAPFRGFWQERRFLQDQAKAKDLGKTTLYFGCRTRQMVLYKRELEKMQKCGVVRNIFNAYSREIDVPKVYRLKQLS